MSRAEGFATATTEAFFCGVPVLTSDIDNFKEQVEEGVNGYTSQLGNEKLLKENFLKLKSLSAKKYNQLADGANTSFTSASLHKVCLQIYEIYKNLNSAQ
jgi:glycosyltransferase involved in cell wall biosynthesis